MFPHVDGEQAALAARHRRVGVRSGDDLEAAFLLHQPGPAAAELRRSGVGELSCEALEGAEVVLDAALEQRGGLAALRRKRVPVEIVVPGLRGVVEELARAVAHDLLEARARDALLLKQLVHGIDVFLVVLAVMQGQGLAGDVRLERVLGVRQRRQRKMRAMHGFCSG